MKQKKLYVLTGFLGSGKTSLLLHLLDHTGDAKVGVIQNEFGKISIDGILSRRDGIEMTEITRGSIFCSCLKLNFVQALAEMGQKDLDYVIVESSGLADPSNIEEILNAVKLLAGDCYRFEGAICLIDAVNFPVQLADIETVDRQLSHCHMAVINKTDLVDHHQLQAVIAAVRKVNPRCRLELCQNGKIDLAFLNEDLTLLAWAECEDSLNTVDNKPKTISMECSMPVAQADLTAFLQKVLPDTYRIKGFFLLNEGWFQVDVVEKLIEYHPTERREISQMVFLSKIGPKVIRTVDSAWKETMSVPMKLKN